MRTLLPRDRGAEDERVRRLIASLTQQRDQAYQDGYTLGWLDGHEAGLRQVLADAELALGRAA